MNVLQSNIVSILDFKINSKAPRLAQKLLNEAKISEPQITEDLLTIAKSIEAEMVGLENKFKSLESLERKLRDESIKRNVQIEKIAKRNNDTLRYTFVFDEGKYAEGFAETIAELKNFGYFIPEKRIWNAWELEGLEIDKGYRGINATIISSQKQPFELQFHTKASFRLKTETHVLYEETRNPNTSLERNAEIVEIILPLASKIKRPRGI